MAEHEDWVKGFWILIGLVCICAAVGIEKGAAEGLALFGIVAISIVFLNS